MRKIFQILKVVSLVTIIVASFFLVKTLKQASFMPIYLIRVFGDLQYINKYELAEEILPYAKGFFNTDVKAIQQTLATMPWIDQVTVEKRWPNKLLIEIHGQQLLAIFNNNSVINLRGEIIKVNVKNMPAHNLPRLVGHEHELASILDFFNLLQTELSKINLTVSKLENKIDIGWCASLNNDIKLVIGRDELNERITRFVGLFKTKKDLLQKVSTIDLRYTNGVAIG
jgi:cell division protein FtsQ